nr:MAG TPA: hypothetical protein [Caudoviricetes sp.]DAJ45143.1 MAG TPA: hypothetical protein [Caudoviricetes sp.]DAS84375.1 MAG TPA: hypothetical protein [Caudoviricetes sp.]
MTLSILIGIVVPPSLILLLKSYHLTSFFI